MRFSQLDRITEIKTGQSLTAIKCLSLSEQYLHDHFPRFPVMPGVLMLEAMFQASMWMIRHRDQFTRSMVVLRETRNVKFGDFVEPGRQLKIVTTQKSMEPGSGASELTTVQVKATIDDRSAVGGRLVLESFNLADAGLGPAATDVYMQHRFLRHFRLLYPLYRDQQLPLTGSPKTAENSGVADEATGAADPKPTEIPAN